ncbi:MAG TPA: alpha/beta hydrolase, partial [Dehalococcoidia bacterium]|nr:alpha/beta hydrolase [Dehalococcoidia bacterium]
KQIDALAGRHRVIAPDLRGLGRSQRVAFAPDVFRREAADLIDLAGTLGIERCHIVGFSAGSLPARVIPIERPDLVATLTLIAAPDRLAGPVLEKVRRLLIEETRQPKFAALLADLHGADYWEDLCNARVEVETRFAEQTGGDPTGGRLGQIRCPVLIVRGEHDHLTPRSNAEALAARIPWAERRELPGGSHFVPQESADWLNPILLEWFARHPIDQAAAGRIAPGSRAPQDPELPAYCKS